MWLVLRAILAGIGTAVLRALGAWLATEAAKFVAENLADAKIIVAQASAKKDMSNGEKAKWAAEKLRFAVIAAGKAHKDAWINQAIEIAWETVKQEIEKKQSGQPK